MGLKRDAALLKETSGAQRYRENQNKGLLGLLGELTRGAGESPKVPPSGPMVQGLPEPRELIEFSYGL